jgi:hypothetical protein
MDQSITYRFELNDYAALVRAGRTLGLLGWLGRWGRIALFTLVFGTLVLIAAVTTTFWDAPMSTVLGFAAFIYALLFATVALADVVGEPLLFRHRYRRFAIADKQVALRLNDNGVRATFAGVESSIPWPSFTRLIEASEHLFLFLSRAEAIVIPVRAVGNSEKLAELARSIRAKLGATPQS